MADNNIGIITEQGDMGLGFNILTEADKAKYSASEKTDKKETTEEEK